MSRLATYSDVPSTYPQYYTIEAATRLGLMSGYPDGTFKPNQAVTRAELADVATRSFVRGALYTGAGLFGVWMLGRKR